MRRTRDVTAVLLAALCMLVPSHTAAKQSGQLGARDTVEPTVTGEAAVAGRVTNTDGQPVHRAALSLYSDNGRIRRSAASDRDGRFEVRDLPGGRYFLRVQAAGYIPAQLGQRHPDEEGVLLALAPRERRTVDVVLQRGAAVAGLVTDEFGAPVTQATVQVYRLRHGPDGRRAAAELSTTSDDRGAFRVFGLVPGDYLVSTELRSSVGLGAAEPPVRYYPAYHPGTLDVELAQPLTLRAGDDQYLPLVLVPGTLARISGRVFTADGRPAHGASIVLTPVSGISRWLNGRVEEDGRFAVDGVAPGDHVLSVRFDGAGERPREGASMTVHVPADGLADVRVTTSPGGTLTGRVVFDGVSSPPETTLRVYPSPADSRKTPVILGPGSPNHGLVGPDGAFSLTGIVGAVVPLLGAQGWQVRSVTYRGRDISEDGLDPSEIGPIDGVVITLTDRLTRLSGAVRDARGRPTIDAVIVVVPEGGRAQGPLRSDPVVFRPGTDGRFDVAGLMPGRYAAAAVEWFEPRTQHDPEVQQRIRRDGRAFALDEGQSLTLDLTVTARLPR